MMTVDDNENLIIIGTSTIALYVDCCIMVFLACIKLIRYPNSSSTDLYDNLLINTNILIWAEFLICSLFVFYFINKNIKYNIIKYVIFIALDVYLVGMIKEQGIIITDSIAIIDNIFFIIAFSMFLVINGLLAIYNIYCALKYSDWYDELLTSSIILGSILFGLSIAYYKIWLLIEVVELDLTYYYSLLFFSFNMMIQFFASQILMILWNIIIYNNKGSETSKIFKYLLYLNMILCICSLFIYIKCEITSRNFQVYFIQYLKYTIWLSPVAYWFHWYYLVISKKSSNNFIITLTGILLLTANLIKWITNLMIYDFLVISTIFILIIDLLILIMNEAKIGNKITITAHRSFIITIITIFSIGQIMYILGMLKINIQEGQYHHNILFDQITLWLLVIGSGFVILSISIFLYNCMLYLYRKKQISI